MKKRLSVATLLLSIITLTGCATGEKFPSSEVATATRVNVIYWKDYRSSLCFGSVKSYTYNHNYVISITNVPCDKVEHLLVK